MAVTKSSIASRFGQIVGKSLRRDLPGSLWEAEGDAGGQAKPIPGGRSVGTGLAPRFWVALSVLVGWMC